MPKPMLKRNQDQANNLLSATKSSSAQACEIEPMKLNRMLRKSRSKEYMEALHKLDAGGHTHNQHKVDEIINAILAEFPEVDITGILLGYVSICYLGEPYEVHTLDLTGRIIQHYQVGQALPDGLEKARSLALRGRYEFIEVYTDCCRCISANGSVSVVTM